MQWIINYEGFLALSTLLLWNPPRSPSWENIEQEERDLKHGNKGLQIKFQWQWGWQRYQTMRSPWCRWFCYSGWP